MRPFTTDIAAIPIEVNLAAESIGEHALRITSIRKSYFSVRRSGRWFVFLQLLVTISGLGIGPN